MWFKCDFQAMERRVMQKNESKSDPLGAEESSERVHTLYSVTIQHTVYITTHIKTDWGFKGHV